MLKFKTNESQSEIDTNIFAWPCGMRKKVSFVICKYSGYNNKSDLFSMHAMSRTWSSLRLVEDKSKETRAVLLESNYPISAALCTFKHPLFSHPKANDLSDKLYEAVNDELIN